MPQPGHRRVKLDALLIFTIISVKSQVALQRHHHLIAGLTLLTSYEFALDLGLELACHTERPVRRGGVS